MVEVNGSTFNLQFEDLLLFTTGVPAEPPLGFSPGLSIRFTEGMLPRANTCINAMYLPMNTVTPEEFIHNNYVFWLTQCCRFWAGLGVEGRK